MVRELQHEFRVSFLLPVSSGAVSTWPTTAMWHCGTLPSLIGIAYHSNGTYQATLMRLAVY